MAYNRKYREKHNAGAARYRANHPKRNKEIAKKWRNNHPEKLQENHLKHSYGINLAQYHKMLENQGNACASCHRLFENIPVQKRMKTSICIDHNHETGHVRALLCRECNQALGCLHDDPVMIQRLYEYAKICNQFHQQILCQFPHYYNELLK